MGLIARLLPTFVRQHYFYEVRWLARRATGLASLSGTRVAVSANWRHDPSWRGCIMLVECAGHFYGDGPSIHGCAMADVFISFKTDDTSRVQAVHDGFRASGLRVFWSNDIPKGAADYQVFIKAEILKASVVVVVWTKGSVHSGDNIERCSLVLI